MDQHQHIPHGALDHAELAALGIDPAGILDFSSNLNPFGPPAEVRAALAALNPAPYPDRSCLHLRRALAERHQCSPEAILIGNGANELIHLIARALLNAGDRVLVIGPTYGEYSHASRLMGASIDDIFDTQCIVSKLKVNIFDKINQELPYRLTWICSPNNPTGTEVAPEQLDTLAKQLSAQRGLLIIDRTYHALRRNRSPWHDPLDRAIVPNVIRLYSLTKSYALAGLRLGYLIATPDLCATIGAYQPTWSVNSAAQAAGLAALEAEHFLETTIPRLWDESDRLHDGLQALGYKVWRASLPMLLLNTGDGPGTRQRLLSKGCMVRDCTSFGLPDHIRIAPQHPEANARLLEAVRLLRP